MKPAVGLCTVTDFLKYPEGTRVQLIEGGLVMEPASPNLFHQDVSRNVTLLLTSHVRAHALGKVYSGPVDVPGSISRPSAGYTGITASRSFG